MSEKNKIRVEIVIGPATVRVEAPPDQIEEAVRNAVAALRSALPELGANEVLAGSSMAKPEKARRRPAPTCSELIRGLISEGWFDQPRTLSEVVQELAKKGYHYDSTAIAHSLLDLVREKALVREGIPRRYAYRKPSPAIQEQR
ncbi:MAG: hypothetical protein QXI18_04530 [Nitrososphaerota archaeon]